MPRELPRRLFHSLGGLVAAVPGLLLPRGIFLPILFAVAGGFVLLDVIRFKHRRINAWFLVTFRHFLRAGETTRITGASYMGVGAVVAFVCFEPVIASLSMFFLALGDPLSGIVGGKWGRLTAKNKSLQSSAACFAACLAAGLAFSLLLGVAVPSVVVAALAATVVESLPLPVNDNVTIPVVAGGVMTAMNLLAA